MAARAAGGGSSYTPVGDIADMVESVRHVFGTGATRDMRWRRHQINGVKRFVKENFEALEEALRADLKATAFYSSTVELPNVIGECDDALHNLSSWVAPEKVGTPLVMLPAASWIESTPRGLVLIISPWNYPVSLLLSPLVAAFAAGNTAVLKPSELSEATSGLIATLLPKYLDKDAVAIVQGAVAETSELLKQRFDFIVYTGNGSVARIVMRAAAEHLTPVMLELGGKCPAYVDKSANLYRAASRIAWGKWTLNHGQSCVSPDYVLVAKEVEAEFTAEMIKVLKQFFGDDPKSSPDVSRIINERHTRRVAGLLDDDAIEVLHGGAVDIADRYVEPTLVKAPHPNVKRSKVMDDEIFGPILPILPVADADAAIEFINESDTPLALYVFAEDSRVQKAVVAHTNSGSVGVNDTAIYLGNMNLPFGGVGGSGMGAYHGKHGFDALSHKRACFKKYGSDAPARFAPHDSTKLSILRFARKIPEHHVKRAGMLLLLVVVASILARTAM